MNRTHSFRVAFLSVIVLFGNQLMAAEETNQLVEHSIQDKNRGLLKHLSVGNVVNGVVTLAGLTTLGYTGITSTNHYPLTTLTVIGINSLFFNGYNCYVTHKLSKSNIAPGNNRKLIKLSAARMLDVALSGIGALATVGVQISDPKVNNVVTNLLLTIPLTAFGHIWSNVYDNFRHYKKLKEKL